MNFSIENLSRRFESEDGEGVNALCEISLEVKQGEFICILGPSGCGKTTLLRIIAGLEEPTDGHVKMNDEEVHGPNENLVMIFQDYSLFPWKNIADNVMFGLELRGVPPEKRREKAEEYIELVGLSSFRTNYPHELSGGMRQRVAVARALAVEPAVLLMDEPFGALDAQTRNLLQCEILEIWEKTHKTILFVTHSVDEALFLADRIIVLTSRPGKIREIIDVNLPRPRERTDAEFGSLRKYVLRLIVPTKKD